MSDATDRIKSAESALQALYNNAADPGGETLHFAIAAHTESQIAIAAALVDVADAIRAVAYK